MLAAETLKSAGRSSPARIRYAFRRATGRTPTAREVTVLEALVKQELDSYRSAPGKAAALLSAGESPVDPGIDKPELAAWTTLASALLNLDEVITKE